MLLQSPRALYLAPGRPGSISKYSEALVRSTGVSGRFASGFRTDLHFAEEVITFQRRILCSKIRELILQALTQHQENSAAACNILPSGADLAAPLISQSYSKPEFMGPQNRHDGKHPHAMIKDFRALRDNTQDATHCVAIYSSTWKLIKHTSRNKTYI